MDIHGTTEFNYTSRGRVQREGNLIPGHILIFVLKYDHQSTEHEASKQSNYQSKFQIEENMGPYNGPNESPSLSITLNEETKSRSKDGNETSCIQSQKATEVVRPPNDTQLVTKLQTTTSYVVTTFVELYDIEIHVKAFLNGTHRLAEYILLLLEQQRRPRSEKKTTTILHS